MSTFSIEADHGFRAFTFEPAYKQSETSLLLKGPTRSQPGAGEHVGSFKIHYSRQIALQARFASEFETFVEVHAVWYIRLGEVMRPAGQDGPLITRNFGGGDTWTTVDLAVVRRGIPNDVTHWRPKFVFTKDPGDGNRVPLDETETVYIDSLYLPENGRSLIDQAYLDGDQPYGLWEGTPRDSSSVYRSNAGPNLGDPAAIILGEVLVIDE